MRNGCALLPVFALLFCACGSAPSKQEPVAIDYGDEPTAYEAPIREYFDRTLKDPSSLQIKEIKPPEKGWFRAPLIAGGRKTYGWMIKATINAKNSYGGYVGFRTYSFLFRGNRLVETLSPDAD